MNNTVSALVALALVSSLPAQITHWRIVKGPTYTQTSGSVPTVVREWNVYAVVQSQGPGDVAQVAVSGGAIAGSLAFEQEEPGYFVLDRSYPTQAAMNAEFPSSSSYVLHASGGTLGVLSQSLSFGSEVYPPTAYLTNGVHAAIQQYDPTAQFTFMWNSPGGNTSSLQLLTRDDDEVIQQSPGAATSLIVPANTLVADECYLVDVEFQNGAIQQAAGFGVAGDSSHNTITTAYLGTFSVPTAGPCGYSETYGDGCDGLDLNASPPIAGTSWLLTTDGVSPLGFAFTFFGLGEQSPTVPLSLIGLPAPGCGLHIDASLIITSLGGAAPAGQLILSVPIPCSTALWGSTLFAQSVGLTTANPAGIATSNGLSGFIGGR